MYCEFMYRLSRDYRVYPGDLCIGYVGIIGYILGIL